MNNEPTPTPQQTPPQQSQVHSDSFQTFIPTKNMPALIGYYLGIFSLIPFLGAPLAIAAVILGAVGLKKHAHNPTPGAKGHAITAIVLGSIQLICFVGFFIYMAVASTSAGRI